MTLRTVDIPQADVLWHVARVPEAILRGATTTEAVGAFFGAKVPRQGNYYTQAARILGLVAQVNPDGAVELTPYGRAFGRYDRTSQQRALRHRMLVCEPTRSVIAALIANGDSMALGEIAYVLQCLAPLSSSTAERRAKTIVAWLRDLAMAEWRDGRLYYTGPRLLGAVESGMQAPTARHTRL